MKKTKLFRSLFISIIIIGVITMLFCFDAFNKQKDLIYCIQMFSFITMGFFQFFLYENKPKGYAIFGTISDIIACFIMFKYKIYALAITYLFGIFSELFLLFKGENYYQSDITIKSEYKKVTIIMLIATLCYFVFYTSDMNLWAVLFDYLGAILIPQAYYFQMKQSRNQFKFWILSDIFGLINQILTNTIFGIITFPFYLILDILNYINWEIKWKNKKS